MYNSLALKQVQIQPPNPWWGLGTPLALDKEGSQRWWWVLFWTGPQEPPWPAIPPEAMLIWVPSCCPRPQWSLWSHIQSVPPLMPQWYLCCAASGNHAEVSGLCNHLRPCWGSWSTQPLRVMSGSVVQQILPKGCGWCLRPTLPLKYMQRTMVPN